MKIGVLCNSRIALQSIHWLSQNGHQVVIGMPDVRQDELYEIESFAHQFGISIEIFEKTGLTEKLHHWKIFSGLESIFIIGFPFILSADLLGMMNIPVVNFHFAPLPNYKGAQPMFWLIKSGEKKGGVVAHIATAEVDSGPILHFESYTINQFETFGSYLLKMASLCVTVLQKALPKIKSGSWKNIPKQKEKAGGVIYKKPQLADIRINWAEMSAIEIEQLCRACNPWNKGAITYVQNIPIKLVEVSFYAGKLPHEVAGTVVKDSKSGKLLVATSNQKYLFIEIVYVENQGYYGNQRLGNIGLRSGLRLV